MASTAEYLEFVCDQMRDLGPLRYRKMFGEYMVYRNDKPVLLVCDNTVFVTMHPELESLMAQAEKGIPYAGSKAHYILDIENAALCRAVLAVLDDVTPVPKKKKAKSSRQVI